MLEALKRIEDRSPPAPRRDEPEPPPCEPAVCATVTEEPPKQEEIPQPVEPVQVESQLIRPRPVPPLENPAGAMPTLVVGMYGSTEKQDMPTTSVGMAPTGVGMAPIGNHLPQQKPTKTLDPRYRDLAENILSRLPHEAGAVFMLVDADGKEDGGLAVQLGTALAERIEGNMLLVDCDLHHPSLASRFAIDADLGLAHVLGGEARWPQAVCPTDVAGLDVLGGGKASVENDGTQPPAKADLAPLLDELRSHYRLVLLAGTSADEPKTASAAAACDGVYVVVRLRQTPRRAARRAVGRIQQHRGRVLGCVLLDG
jgi:Mrp family chromosome partitioning ATPase